MSENVKRPAPILPGATLGILGSGQLGRMFAIAAKQMGYRIHTYSPEKDSPTGQVADFETQGSYDDKPALEAFAKSVSVVTFEFENIPLEAIEAISAHVAVRPAGSVLHTTQNRLREKRFLSKHGYPLANFRAVSTKQELHEALGLVGYPCVLKTAGFGYDGKGQTKIHNLGEAEAAWVGAQGKELVLEAFVEFEKEVSVVASRALSGEVRCWPVFENRHRKHVLDVTLCPAEISVSVAEAAQTIARDILTKLDAVGVVCVEFFLTKAGKLLVNEIAPRPHNSGHLTIEASVTSQFEQQVRAVCGLGLGSTDTIGPSAMANLLGEIWGADKPPDWASLTSDDRVKLHLYGKAAPRVGRKMGHLVAMDVSAAAAAERVVRAREAIRVKDGKPLVGVDR